MLTLLLKMDCTPAILNFCETFDLFHNICCETFDFATPDKLTCIYRLLVIPDVYNYSNKKSYLQAKVAEIIFK